MAAAILAAPAAADALTFTDVTDSAGLATTHGYATAGMYLEPGIVAGGVAAADYDRDGYPDLFVVRGDLGPAHLFRNRGDGTFTDVAEQAGVAVGPGRYSSATFGDVDGDGWRDLIVVGFDGTQPVLLRNRGDGTFEDITAGSGLLLPQLHSFSMPGRGCRARSDRRPTRRRSKYWRAARPIPPHCPEAAGRSFARTLSSGTPRQPARG